MFGLKNWLFRKFHFGQHEFFLKHDLHQDNYNYVVVSVTDIAVQNNYCVQIVVPVIGLH